MRVNVNAIEKGLITFSMKIAMVNISSVIVTQFCYCKAKVAIDGI